ncbi:MAG TPA: DNA methyltransferase [Candidatus Avalokitesvara rifleensis]|uniref:DNA methyltransferase n=1 Tax=Candidatus Avalokitesvara rifleensis TaxID=3367620 RepID=UPI002712E162|nr:DNA methyltransferase [Candidatus Brocadiales bacterium]
MQTVAQERFYPISLDEIKIKVAKKNGRRAGLSNGNGRALFNNHLAVNVTKITNEFNERIIRVDGEIPTNLVVNKKDRFLFISYDQSILTHGLHKYPAKFFPELPRWFIKGYSKENELVLDPFSGSGTTNVEALLLRRNSVGIDVDPFPRFLSKVKTTPLHEEELNASQKYLLRATVNYHPSKVLETDIPSFPYRDNWFNKEIILELAYLKKAIESLDASTKTKDFFKMCFSSVIRSVSNADDNCTRTVIREKLNKRVYPADALKKFTISILVNVPKMIEFSKKCPRKVRVSFPENQDARNINYPENCFDLALTSPPYANAVDYPRTHQLESYWLGLANGSLTPLKKKHVGTESVSSDQYRVLHKIGVVDADKVISRIYKEDPRRAFIAYKYLEDMNENLKEVHRVLRINGRYVVVVGNNKIRGQLFENWKYIMSLAEDIGFRIENYFASEIIKHFIKVPREERINTDWVIILRK